MSNLDNTELLTINGVTKICSNSVYVNSNNVPLSFQWFDFQLDYVFENNKLSTISPITKQQMSRVQKAKYLKNIFLYDNIRIHGLNEQNLIKYGFVNPEKLTENNIGGIQLFTPELDEYGVSIKIPIVSNEQFYEQ